MNYNLADFVRFKKGSGYGIGRIEDLTRDEDWFEYFEYLTPDELPQGNNFLQPHHGTNEVFKTDLLIRAKLSDIIEKVNLYKLTQYNSIAHGNVQNKDHPQGYIMRQEYIGREFRPPLKVCLCGSIVNPDNQLYICSECDKPFHLDCIQRKISEQGTAICDNCRFEVERVYLPRKAIVPEVKRAPVQVIEEEEEEQLEDRHVKIDLDKLIKKNIKKNDNTGQPVYLPRKLSPQKQSQPAPAPVEKFKNIPASSLTQMKQWIDRYRQQDSKLENNFEKRRQDVRERLFQCVYYGYEELRLSGAVTEVEHQILANPDPFSFVKNICVDIEVLLNLKFNNSKNSKFEPAYIERCKLIIFHMKDDKNAELRRKVITREYTSNDLCTKDEADFYNPERRKEMLAMTLRGIELNQKAPEQQIEIELEETLLSKQQSLNDDQQKQQISRGQHLKDKMAEYSVEKSIIRFTKRIEDELKEKEAVLILKNLNDIKQ